MTFSTLNSKQFYAASGIIFFVVACLHLLRLFNHSVFIVGSWHVPRLISWIAVFAAGYLAYCAYDLHEGKKK
jgi:hypothetical protein